jgi:5-oxopent-3-ene-1,2,5-tricarboxylate decarboxylase/2-hydroxyhepta-2,4-diene-1,7-dioate isomerase
VLPTGINRLTRWIIRELLLYPRPFGGHDRGMETHGKVRVSVAGIQRWGELSGSEVEFDDGTTAAAADVTFLPPVEPSKIIASHLTYRSRVDEYAAVAPAHPSYFLKPPSSLNGHRGEVVRPAGAEFLNYEGELAVVVGRRMHRVPEDEVLDYVGAYTVANDVGLHDLRHADRGSMLRVKGQDGFLPIGPRITPAAEFDPTRFTLRTRRNGEVVQEATAQDMVWGVAYQLADICRLITLEPGDVVLTGTPANSRPLDAGDVVSVEIDGLGRVENTVVDSADELAGPGELPQTSAQTLHVALTIPEDEAERMIQQRSGAITRGGSE